MKLHLDWTYDADGNFGGLPDIVNDLHSHSQKYVIIVVSWILSVLFTRFVLILESPEIKIL